MERILPLPPSLLDAGPSETARVGAAAVNARRSEETRQAALQVLFPDLETSTSDSCEAAVRLAIRTQELLRRRKNARLVDHALELAVESREKAQERLRHVLAALEKTREENRTTGAAGAADSPPDRSGDRAPEHSGRAKKTHAPTDTGSDTGVQDAFQAPAPAHASSGDERAAVVSLRI